MHFLNFIRRRPRHRRLRHRQPTGIFLRDDRHGHQPRHAAHRRLQLRRPTVRTRAARAAADHHRRDGHHFVRIRHRRISAAHGSLALHLRCRAHPHCGRGNAAGIRFLPDHRVPNGRNQLFPKHRDGQQGDFSLAVTATALSAARYGGI